MGRGWMVGKAELWGVDGDGTRAREEAGEGGREVSRRGMKGGMRN